MLACFYIPGSVHPFFPSTSARCHPPQVCHNHDPPSLLTSAPLPAAAYLAVLPRPSAPLSESHPLEAYTAPLLSSLPPLLAPQSHAEEINIILPGHNYLWRNFEGNFSFSPPFPSPVASLPEAESVGSKAWPVFQYLHMCSPDSSPAVECVESDYVAVIGGVVYRSALRNKCLQVCVKATGNQCLQAWCMSVGLVDSMSGLRNYVSQQC